MEHSKKISSHKQAATAMVATMVRVVSVRRYMMLKFVSFATINKGIAFLYLVVIVLLVFRVLKGMNSLLIDFKCYF